MLKITRTEDAIKVDQLVVVVYGAPGLGKSTLGFTTDKPLLLDFDRGAYRAANRQDSVQVDKWADVANISPEDLASYNTVLVDTAGRALDLLTADIIEKNYKMGNGGNLTLQGYGALKAQFTGWLKNLRIYKKDVVLIAHSSEDKKGDDIIERLDVQGGSKGEIYKSADAMGRLYLVNGKRTLSFSPTDTAFGKNPGNMEAQIVPDVAQDGLFLGKTIQTIKDKLNALTEEQEARLKAIGEWKGRIDKAKTASDFNSLVGDIQKAPSDIRQIVRGHFKKAVEGAGVVFDKESNCYQEAA